MEWVTYAALVIVFVALRLTLRFATGGFRWSGNSSIEEKHARSLVKRGRSISSRPAADAPDATVVRITGEVRVHESALTAPISGSRCAYWRVVIYEQRGAGVSQSWEHLAQHSEHTPFIVADPSGEVLVDPALATVSMRSRQSRIVSPREAVPQQVATLLVERGWSMDDLRRRDRPIRIDETTVASGASVAVVGAGTSSARRGALDELDYRSTSPTWLVLSGRDSDLLISDDRALRRRSRAGARNDAGEDWVRRVGDAHAETSGEDVDVFEGRLRWRMRFIRTLMVAAVIVAVVKVAFALGLARLWTESPPEKPPIPMLGASQRALLRNEIDRQRVAAYRGDDAWRAALQARERVVELTDAPCPQYAMLERQRARSFKDSFSASDPDAPFPLLAIEVGGALPVTSPTTNAHVVALDRLDRAIATARADEYESLRAQVFSPPESTVDVLVELVRDPTHLRVRAWAYDHQVRRIVCAGHDEYAETEPSPRSAGFAISILESLRDVSSEEAVQP